MNSFVMNEWISLLWGVANVQKINITHTQMLFSYSQTFLDFVTFCWFCVNLCLCVCTQFFCWCPGCSVSLCITCTVSSLVLILLFFFTSGVWIQSFDYIPGPFLLFTLRHGLAKSLHCPGQAWTHDHPSSVSRGLDDRHVPHTQCSLVAFLTTKHGQYVSRNRYILKYLRVSWIHHNISTISISICIS